MKPLYTQEEFDAAKYNELLPLECIGCGKKFAKQKYRIQDVLNPNRPEKANYCCHPCFSKNSPSTQATSVICDHCGKTFNKIPKEIKKSKHNFCCQSHAAKYHNAHKKGGCRVSKLEKWLQSELPLIFPDLEFHFNRVDAIKAELDIYVPFLRLAFELNGIFHYEPIFGPEQLAKMQTNDQRKMQACLENGIELCILDVSRETYFKPSKAQKYLDIIANIIHAKLSDTLLVAEQLPG